MSQLCFVSNSTTKQLEDRGDSVDENPEKEKSVIFSWRNDSYNSLTTRPFNVMYECALDMPTADALICQEIWSENVS